eukprot:1040127-Amphidinium_carterae.6
MAGVTEGQACSSLDGIASATNPANEDVPMLYQYVPQEERSSLKMRDGSRVTSPQRAQITFCSLASVVAADLDDAQGDSEGAHSVQIESVDFVIDLGRHADLVHNTQN